MIRQLDLVQEAPIILLAVARSGSSLLRSLLTVHPEVRLLESTLISALLDAFPEFRNRAVPPTDQLVQHARLALYHAFRDASFQDPDMGTLHKKCVKHWGFTIHQIAERQTFDLLAAGFPQAKFIHLVRDGRAVCSSWLDNWELATGLTSEPDLAWAMDSWSRSVVAVHGGPNHHLLKLEDLTCAEKRIDTFSSLMSFLGIKVSPRQGAFMHAWPAINTRREAQNLARRRISEERATLFTSSKPFQDALRLFGYQPGGLITGL